MQAIQAHGGGRERRTDRQLRRPCSCAAGAQFSLPAERRSTKELGSCLRRSTSCTVVPDFPVIHRPITENFASATQRRGACCSSDRGGRPSLSPEGRQRQAG